MSTRDLNVIPMMKKFQGHKYFEICPRFKVQGEESVVLRAAENVTAGVRKSIVEQ